MRLRDPRAVGADYAAGAVEARAYCAEGPRRNVAVKRLKRLRRQAIELAWASVRLLRDNAERSHMSKHLTPPQQDDYSRRPATPVPLNEAIKDYIRQNVTNPDLSVGSIVCNFNISSRYIHKVFEPSKFTVKSYIVENRLNGIRRDLLDGSLLCISIHNIAFRWGFRDLTTFHRNFKSRYGCTPGEMRRLPRRGR